MEGYYINKGWLLPTFHKHYWIGLNATSPGSSSPATWLAGKVQSSPAKFAWLEKAAGVPVGRAYQHWGKAGTADEPNNLLGNENCGVANASAKYSLAWGWADISCKISAPFICKSQREWLRSGAPAAAHTRLVSRQHAPQADVSLDVMPAKSSP